MKTFWEMPEKYILVYYKQDNEVRALLPGEECAEEVVVIAAINEGYANWWLDIDKTNFPLMGQIMLCRGHLDQTMKEFKFRPDDDWKYFFHDWSYHFDFTKERS